MPYVSSESPISLLTPSGWRTLTNFDDSIWKRPTDYLTLPQPGADEVIMLVAVFSGSYGNYNNNLRMQVTTAHTINWGDGVTQSFASNTTATRSYDYASIPSSSLTSEGWRQVIVRITPQSGSSLTGLNLLSPNPNANVQTSAPGIIEIVYNTPFMTSAFPQNWSTAVAKRRYLQSLYVRNLAQTTTGTVGGGDQRFTRVLEGRFPKSTSLNNFCNSWYGLEQITALEMPECTNTTSMFTTCTGLRYIPSFSAPKLVTATTMFQTCRSLLIVPFIDMPLATTLTSMFDACSALRNVAGINMPAATTTANMFSNCFALKKCSALTSSAALINTSAMFQNCYVLDTVNLFDTQNVTNFSSMFQNCGALRAIPSFNTAKVTNFSNAFENCQNILTFPSISTVAATTVGAMFNGCSSLLEIPALNFAAVTSAPSNLFGSCQRLSRSQITGMRYAHAYTGCNLSRDAIIEIFNNLGTAAGAQTINVQYNPGSASLIAADIAIATGKGWTVTYL